MIEIKVVRTLDALVKAYAVRAAVYMAEQDCPYAEEVDGNDLCATHFIALEDGEPIGCLRARFFADFAKLERLTVLKPLRGSHIALQLVAMGIEHIRRKGYTKIYGDAQKGVEKFWSKFGAIATKGKGEFVVSGVTYIEMIATFPLHSHCISLDSEAMVILRPEGDWDRPGVLETQKGER